MPNMLLNQIAQQAGLDIYAYHSDPHDLPHPLLDKHLIEAFENCQFNDIEQLLARHAHGNQRFFLTEKLIQEIVKAHKDFFLPWILRKSRYEIVFDPKYSAEEKKAFLQVASAPKNTIFSEELLEKITLAELKKNLADEFTGKECVSLLWVAVFLKRPDLVKLLLTAPKPADPFTPMILKSLKSNKMGPFFWQLIGDGKYCCKELVEILEIFLENGVLPEDLFPSDQDSQEWWIFLAVETRNFPLLNLILKQGFDINCYIETEDYPFSYFHSEHVNIERDLPQYAVTPLSIALFNKDREMAKFLIANQAHLFYLTDLEQENLYCLLLEQDG